MLCFLLLHADLSGPLAFERQTAWRQTNPEAVALAAGERQARDYLDILTSHSKSTLGADASELDAINKVMPQGLKVTKYSRLTEGWLFTCNKFNVFLSCANKMWWEISEKLGQGVATLIRCFEQRENLKPVVSVPKDTKVNTSASQQTLHPSGRPVDNVGTRSAESTSSNIYPMQQARSQNATDEFTTTVQEVLTRHLEHSGIAIVQLVVQEQEKIVRQKEELEALRVQKEQEIVALKAQTQAELTRERQTMYADFAQREETTEQHKRDIEAALAQREREINELAAAKERDAREHLRMLEEKRKDLEETQRAYEELCGGMEYVERVTQEAEQIKQKAAKTLQENTAMADRLATTERERVVLEARLTQMTASYQRVLQQNAEEVRAKEDLQAQLVKKENATRVVMAKERQQQALDEAFRDAKTKSEQSATELQTKQRSIVILEEEKNRVEARVRALTEDQEKLQRLLERADSETKTRYASLAVQIAEKQQEIAELSTALEKAQKEKTTLQERKVQLEIDLNKAEQRAQQAEGEHRQAIGTIGTMTNVSKLMSKLTKQNVPNLERYEQDTSPKKRVWFNLYAGGLMGRTYTDEEVQRMEEEVDQNDGDGAEPTTHSGQSSHGSWDSIRSALPLGDDSLLDDLVKMGVQASVAQQQREEMGELPFGNDVPSSTGSTSQSATSA